MPHPNYKSSAASHLTFGYSTSVSQLSTARLVCLELRFLPTPFPNFRSTLFPNIRQHHLPRPPVTRTLSRLSTARLPRPPRSPPYTLFRPVALPSSFRLLSSPTLSTASLLQPGPQLHNNLSDLLVHRESPPFPCGRQIMSRADDDHSSSAANSASPTVCRVTSVAVQLIRFPEIQSMHRPPHKKSQRCRACDTALRRRRGRLGKPRVPWGA